MLKPFIIERPFEADYYALPFDAEFEIFERIFGYPGKPDSLRSRVFKAIWEKLPEIAGPPRMWIEITDDRGWTRPYRDILLEIIEHILNRPAIETGPRLELILRDDAFEFMLAVLRSGVRIERPALTIEERMEWER